ncbi:MAG: hypothetical protein ACRYGK_15745 [Janthinobacterium lividum]
MELTLGRTQTSARSLAGITASQMEPASRQQGNGIGIASQAHLRLIRRGLAESSTQNPLTSEHDSLALDNALATLFLRNNWFFTSVVERAIVPIKEIVIPILRKVFLHKKYPNCFPVPTTGELALFNCFCYSTDARAGYFAYRSDVLHGTPQQGLVPVPKTPEEIQGLIDYYSGHVFGKLGDGKTFEAKWSAVSDFCTFIDNPSCFSAKVLKLDDIEFIQPAVRASISEQLLACRAPAQHLGSQDSSAAAAMPQAAQAGATIHPFSGPIQRRERSVPLALEPIDPRKDIRARKVDFFWYDALEQKTASAGKPHALPAGSASRVEAAAQPYGNVSVSAQSVLLTARHLGRVTALNDLQKLGALAFSRSLAQGGPSFKDAMQLAQRVALPELASRDASLVPNSWLESLPELARLSSKYPDLL